MYLIEVHDLHGVVVDQAHKFHQHKVSLLILAAEHLHANNIEFFLLILKSLLGDLDLSVRRRGLAGAGTKRKRLYGFRNVHLCFCFFIIIHSSERLCT
jgi:hypothetical protein